MAEQAEKALTADGYLHNGKWNAAVGEAANRFAGQVDLAVVVARSTGLEVEQPHHGVYIAYLVIGDMTWPDLNPGPDTHVIIPVGALEPHGPHLPLGSDTTISNHFAHRLAAAVEGHVAPTLGYGVATPGQRLGGAFPGVISITGATFTALVTEILTALARHGYRRQILLNSVPHTPVHTQAQGAPSHGVPTFPYLPDSCLVVLIGASGAGKSTLARTWPASQVLSLDALRETVSDDFSVEFSVWH
ncbi:hypothetical protein Sros01_68080 [Streptomyces roseochromogenus]|nr:hypothetical protein Sros01_68080 [Streptomyces roseochromogenus]